MPTPEQRQTIVGACGELLTAPNTNGRSAPHFHSTFAIGVGRSGGGSLFARGRSWTYSAGMVVVTNPYDPHWGRPDPGGVGYILFYPDPDWLRRLCGGEPMHFERPVIDDPALAERFVAAFAAAHAGGDERLLADAVGDLFRRYARLAPPGAKRLTEAAPAPGDPIAAQAAQAGLSRSHYSRRHRRMTGLSPVDHRRQAQVLAARTMIENGAPLAVAAADSGFADQAHMTRQFRRILGVTPAAYRPLR